MAQKKQAEQAPPSKTPNKQDLISYLYPRQDMPEKELLEQYGSWETYDKQMIRYCCTYYNRPNRFFDGVMSNIGQNSTVNRRSVYSPVLQILENYRYYNGEQLNFDYAFLAKSVKGDEIPAPFIPGQKIFQIVEYLKGTYSAVIRNAKIRTRSLGREAAGRRYKRLQMALTLFDNKDLLEMMQDAGITMEAAPQEAMISKEEIYKHMEFNAYETIELLGNDLAELITRDNDFTNKAIRSWFDTRVGRYSGMMVKVINGRIDIKTFPGYQLIIDNRIDDDLNREAEFRGIIEYMTPEEAFTRFEFTKQERDEILSNAGGLNTLMTPFNSDSDPVNFRWWNTTNRQIAVVHMCWMQLLDTGWKYKLDAKGNRRKPYEYRRVDTTKEVGDIFVWAPRQGTLIANKYLKENKWCDDIVYHPMDKKQPLFPIHFVLPNMVAGSSKSPVDRLRANQDMHDAISLKIRDKMAKAYGKIPIIDGSQLAGVTMTSMEDDFKKLGFTVLNRQSPEADDPSVQRNLVEYADFTMDVDVQTLLKLKMEEERLMNEMYNTSPLVMGTQTTYTGYATQQTSVNQATLSIVNDTQTHVQFLANVLQYAINVAKNYYSTPEGRAFAEEIFSPRMLMLLDKSKDSRFEDLSTIVDILDNIDEAERKEFIMMAQTIIPTGNIEALRIMVDLRTKNTKTELKAAIDYTANSIARKQQEAEAKAASAQAAMLAAKEESATGRVQMEQENENARSEASNEKDITTAVLAHDASTRPPQQ